MGYKYWWYYDSYWLIFLMIELFLEVISFFIFYRNLTNNFSLFSGVKNYYYFIDLVLYKSSISPKQFLFFLTNFFILLLKQFVITLKASRSSNYSSLFLALTKEEFFLILILLIICDEMLIFYLMLINNNWKFSNLMILTLNIIQLNNLNL